MIHLTYVILQYRFYIVACKPSSTKSWFTLLLEMFTDVASCSLPITHRELGSTSHYDHYNAWKVR